MNKQKPKRTNSPNCIVEISLPSKPLSASKTQLKPVFCHCHGDLLDDEGRIGGSGSSRIACSKCTKEFHLKCLGIPSEHANAEFRCTFKCEECKEQEAKAARNPQAIRQGVINAFVSIATNLFPKTSSSTTTNEEHTESFNSTNWASQLEEALFQSYNQSVTCVGYKTKVRSLVYNLKDPKNDSLRLKIASSLITPMELVEMRADELANQEIGTEIQRYRQESLKNSILDGESASLRRLGEALKLNAAAKTSNEEGFFSTLEEVKLFPSSNPSPCSPIAFSSSSDAFLVPVPLGKSPQRMQEYFASTWESLSGSMNCAGMENCAFFASLVGANCWVPKEALWNALELSSLEIQQQIEVEAVTKWLCWARGKKPLLIFEIRNSTASLAAAAAANPQQQFDQEEGQCSPFESLFAHFSLQNKIALVKKPFSSLPEVAKEIYLFPWRKQSPCDKVLFGEEGANSGFAWADSLIPPTSTEDGFLLVVVMKGQLVSFASHDHQIHGSGGGGKKVFKKPEQNELLKPKRPENANDLSCSGGGLNAKRAVEIKDNSNNQDSSRNERKDSRKKNDSFSKRESSRFTASRDGPSWGGVDDSKDNDFNSWAQESKKDAINLWDASEQKNDTWSNDQSNGSSWTNDQSNETSWTNEISWSDSSYHHQPPASNASSSSFKRPASRENNISNHSFQSASPLNRSSTNCTSFRPTRKYLASNFVDEEPSSNSSHYGSNSFAKKPKFSNSPSFKKSNFHCKKDDDSREKKFNFHNHDSIEKKFNFHDQDINEKNSNFYNDDFKDSNLSPKNDDNSSPKKPKKPSSGQNEKVKWNWEGTQLWETIEPSGWGAAESSLPPNSNESFEWPNAQ